MESYQAVLFISFGGPEKREDIRPFLDIVTRGRRIPQDRIEEVVHHYEAIGGASPINAITQRQADGLKALLAKTEAPWPVYVGNRNWHPFLENTLRRMAAEGIQHAIGFITAAHRTEASYERYIRAVEDVRQKLGEGAPRIDYVDPWFGHPLFIKAIGARIEQALKTIPPGRWSTLSWVFSAHSIPTPMAEASSYVQQLTCTAQLVAQAFGITKWQLAYTSRSGRPADPWLEPDVRDAIRTAAESGGAGDIFVIPIGFVADHVEVLYDLDVEAKQAAQQAGIAFYRAGTVGDHPLFLQMMADVVRKTAIPSDSIR